MLDFGKTIRKIQKQSSACIHVFTNFAKSSENVFHRVRENFLAKRKIRTQILFKEGENMPKGKQLAVA